jgi:hypothetical protein
VTTEDVCRVQGVPVREQLFNGTICRPASMFSETNFASRHFGRSSQDDFAALEVKQSSVLSAQTSVYSVVL